MSLEGKLALVTGAGKGIGHVTAIQLAQEGADVAVADIDGEAVEQTSIAIKELGRRSVSIQADMGNLDDVNRAVDETLNGLGGIDILVNNAAVTWHLDFLDVSEQDWDSIHRVNIKGAFFCMQRVAKEMISQGRGGRIINMASVAGQGFKNTSNIAYAASKGGVIAMTYIAAHDLGKHSINVNAICPGVTRTSLLDNMLERRSSELGVSIEELEQNIGKDIPIGRLNEAQDIADMAVFLAGPGARNITGQAMNVDGGLVMH